MAAMSDIIFDVCEDETVGGYIASARGYEIHTQGECLEELRRHATEAVDCYFDSGMHAPRMIRLLGEFDGFVAR
jgi:predicted RNase H-like HicB family nuclease